MDLAAERPAFVFSRLLGFSEQTPANWMTESGGDDAPTLPIGSAAQAAPARRARAKQIRRRLDAPQPGAA
jgi:hypothetical protein